MKELIHRAAGDLVRSKNAVALTGAGISVESGIPPFRGKGGLWERFDPMEYAHIDAFMKNPAKVWDVLIKEIKLPELKTGDILAVAGSGAYAVPLASNYNAAFRPAIVFVKDGKARLVRRRETIKDLTQRDA